MDIVTFLQGGFLARLAIDLACVFVLVRGIFYRAYGRADLFLTFFSFNLAIFVIAFVLNSTEMSMGAAFGLFAVFSMLRYRTEGISTTDMTYLFLGIAIGLVMAVSNAGLLALAGVGALLVGFTFLFESGLVSRRELRHEVMYDTIKLVHAGEEAALIADLRQRTGLNIHRVRVEEIDLVRDMARIAVFHYEPKKKAAAKAVSRLAAAEEADAA